VLDFSTLDELYKSNVSVQEVKADAVLEYVKSMTNRFTTYGVSDCYVCLQDEVVPPIGEVIHINGSLYWDSSLRKVFHEVEGQCTVLLDCPDETIISMLPYLRKLLVEAEAQLNVRLLN
jgi:hypothetical protein